MNEQEWYDDPDLITSMLMGLLILIVIVSQSVAIREQLGLGVMVRSLLNYNCIYLIFFTYLILLKTKFGKRYFNILNICLIVIQLLVCVASLLNIFQVFSILTIVNFLLNLGIVFYMSYVLLKETSLWKGLSLDKIPFQKISNPAYFYTISLIALLSLVASLFGTFTFDGVVLSLLKVMFMIGFARYLYLYRAYQEKKESEKEEKNKVEEEKVKESKKEEKSKKKPSKKKEEDHE